MNFRRLVMFKLFQEVCELLKVALDSLCRRPEFVTDEVPEQAVVSSFFFRSLKVFCSHCSRLFYCPRKNRDGENYHVDVAIEARTVQPTELPISKAVVSIIRRCDLFATPHQITF